MTKYIDKDALIEAVDKINCVNAVKFRCFFVEKADGNCFYALMCDGDNSQIAARVLDDFCSHGERMDGNPNKSNL